MSEQIRSFVAFDIENDSVKSRIAAAQKMLLQTNADLKLVEPKNIHVTIRFLGAINSELVDEIYTAMKNIKYTPFNIQLNGLGVFPTVNYPKVVWAGITAGSTRTKKHI